MLCHMQTGWPSVLYVAQTSEDEACHSFMFCLTCLIVKCRVVLTDHGAFVLINVYAPNAGGGPEGPRAAYKYKFLEALRAKALALQDAGRQVSFGPSCL